MKVTIETEDIDEVNTLMNARRIELHINDMYQSLRTYMKYAERTADTDADRLATIYNELAEINFKE